MKRDIACEECAPKYRDFPANQDGPAEHVLRVFGFALKDYRCDYCNIVIPRETKCVAVSIWIEGQQEYFEWESQFIERISKADWDKANIITKKIMESRK